MVTIICRKYGNTDSVMLSVRIKSGDFNSAVALGISVSAARWMLVSSTLKQARTAYRRGTTIFIDDVLTSKLWELLKRLMAQDKAGVITHKSVDEAIRSTLHQDELEELKRSQKEKEEIEKLRALANKTTLNKFIQKYYEDCRDGIRLKRGSTKKQSPMMVKQYLAFIHVFNDYQKDKHRVVDWDDVTLALFFDFKTWMVEKRQFAPNTIVLQMRIFKTMLRAAREMKLTTTDDFMSDRWNLSPQEVDNIWIPKPRLKEMHDFDVMDEANLEAHINKLSRVELPKTERADLLLFIKSERHRQWLADAKDIFLLACSIGQRVSDFMRVNSKMLVTFNGHDFIQITQQKTGKMVYIPVNNVVREVLLKHGGTLPKMQAQKLVDLVRKIALMLGWTEDAGIETQKGNMSFPSHKKFWECVKTHTARRTFATNAYRDGVPLPAIQAVTGHSSEAMLRKYLKLDSKERALMAADALAKVANNF